MIQAPRNGENLNDAYNSGPDVKNSFHTINLAHLHQKIKECK